MGDDDYDSVVLDVGSFYAKGGVAGFSMETCRSSVCQDEKSRTKVGLNPYEDEGEVVYPVQRGKIVLFDDYEKILHYMLYYASRRAPEEYPHLFVENDVDLIWKEESKSFEKRQTFSKNNEKVVQVCFCLFNTVQFSHNLLLRKRLSSKLSIFLRLK